MRRLKKKIFHGLCATTLVVLGVVRHTVLTPPQPSPAGEGEGKSPLVVQEDDRTVSQPSNGNTDNQTPYPAGEGRGGVGVHPIRGVVSYERAFPDLQDVQIVAARKHGVRPAKNRQDAERRKHELVWVGSSPYYEMDRAMRRSIPYLVPRAADMLHTIGRSFFDSLYVKGIPLHRFVVTSVTRTEEDVQRLRRSGNVNASEQSCHRFGTTIDISYIRFTPVCPPGEDRRTVRDDTLKMVLSEVLRDLRRQQRIYVKHERKQSCFHITTR